MKYILSPNETRVADSFAIEEMGIPSSILMENAARSASDIVRAVIRENCINAPSINIYCGSGNNGGDGFALARHLANNLPNAKIKLVWKGTIDKMTDETETNYFISNQLNIETVHLEDEADIANLDVNCDISIDALIGVGGSENLRGKVIPLLEKINNSRSIKIAIDVPTGLNSETGAVSDVCFKADHTVTMFAMKKGMLLQNAPEYCGKIHVADLGAPTGIVKDLAKNKILELSDIRTILPKRPRNTSKFDYGKVLVIAGSKDMPGAATLTSNAAVRSGAGLVFLYTKKMHPGLTPEVLPKVFDRNDLSKFSTQDSAEILDELQKFSAIAIGPGMGNDSETLKFVKDIITETNPDIPIVIDADALKAIDKNFKLRKNIILTPHIGEFANIVEKDRQEIAPEAYKFALEWADNLNCTILLKNVPSFITDGYRSYINPYGNPGLSSGGSGDVLTGIVLSLLSQGVKPLEAAALGSLLLSSTADLIASEKGMEAMAASDIIDNLGRILT